MRDFEGLDGEITQYEMAILNPTLANNTFSNSGSVATTENTDEPKRRPLLKRIMHYITGRFSTADDVRQPKGNPATALTTVTCRLCEKGYAACDLEGHTEWCSRYQDCIMRRAVITKHLETVHGALRWDLAEATHNVEALRILECLTKALGVDELNGKHSAIRLAKLLYKLAKVDITDNGCLQTQAYLRRAKYLLEQKRVLADRFAELLPNSPKAYYEYSSVTDSSLASTPQRPSTPVGKLTTLFATMLSGRRSTSRSPQFGASPPRPSTLRANFGPIPRISDFEIIKPISRGAYGDVYLARKKATEDLFAIKALRKSDLIRKNMTSHVLTERRVLSLAQAPFVVMLYYAFESHDHLFLVMEYLIGGDLSSVLQELGRLPEATARFYVAELVLALEYLHDHGIIHRDIKPDNMLLAADGHLKLTDFGMADFQGQGQKGAHVHRPLTERVLGTPDYLAPELLRQADHGTAVDWWAVGVCLFEFLFGYPPFTGDSPAEIFDKILAFGKIDWDQYDEVEASLEAKDLISSLLTVDPNMRLGSQGVRAHPFLTGIDWEGLRTCTAPIQPQTSDMLDTSHFAARNRRYASMGLPEDFLEAEPVNAQSECVTDESGVSTPTRRSLSRQTSSPFEGFLYKNIDLLSKVNRRLSSTPASFVSPLAESQASSGAHSDNSFGIS
jgi:serine/threonine protein kinase